MGSLKPVINHKVIAIVFMLIAAVFGILFYMKIEFPDNIGGYFQPAYYKQFGPFAISIELMIAGIYLFGRHRKANFTLALFAFTALLDPLFNLVGLFTSLVPWYAMILFSGCALVSLWLAFTNAFNLGKISWPGAIAGFILGTAFELLFNTVLT